MKTKTTLLLLAASAMSAVAGSSTLSSVPVPAAGSVFDDAVRPISNPTLFDLPVTRTQIHAIYMNHQFPGQIDTTAGSLPLGGEANIVAVQLEYALSDTFSLVAAKDGYAKVNFENTLSDADGFANLGAGAKWVFHRNEATGYAAALTGMIELPTGDDEIFQGEGDGAAIINVSNLKMAGNWQFASTVGFHVPFDNDAESTVGYLSAHASYKVSSWFRPLVELNWFHVLDAGDGGSRFAQAGGAVPGIVEFEGGDLFNLGSKNAKNNRDYVTLALGARFPINETLTLGAAYEFTLTDESASLTEDRITVDAVIRF